MIKNYFDFLYIRIRSKTFHELELYNYKTFPILAKVLHDKNIIDTTNNFLRLFINNENIHTKKFLTCFMIKHHPNVIISNNTDIENEMLLCSTTLLKVISNLNECKNKFSMNYYISRLRLYYSKYIILFDRWKNYDKYRILNDLSTIYLELEQDKLKKYDIDSLSNHEFITSIEREQKKILDKIEQIAGKEGLEYLEKLKKEIDDYKKKIENMYISINENLHNSFWNNFRIELSKDPPNMSVIIARLIEIKSMFLDCDQSLNNELNSNIDIQFIEEMLNRGVIDDKYIYNMCNYIIEVLIRCNSEIKDEGITKFREEMNNDLGKGIMYKDFFPKFFRYIFESIDDIKKQKEIINFIRSNMNQ
jgi:hypothetical protein